MTAYPKYCADCGLSQGHMKGCHAMPQDILDSRFGISEISETLSRLELELSVRVATLAMLEKARDAGGSMTIHGRNAIDMARERVQEVVNAWISEVERSQT